MRVRTFKNIANVSSSRKPLKCFTSPAHFNSFLHNSRNTSLSASAYATCLRVCRSTIDILSCLRRRRIRRATSSTACFIARSRYRFAMYNEFGSLGLENLLYISGPEYNTSRRKKLTFLVTSSLGLRIRFYRWRQSSPRARQAHSPLL